MRIFALFSLWAIILVLPGALRAEETPVTSYADLYIVEKREEDLRRWKIQMGVAQEFSNPYYSITSFSPAVSYYINHHFLVGLRGTGYLSSKEKLTAEVEKTLNAQGIQQITKAPQYSSYLDFAVVPFSGRLNFFNRNAFPFSVLFHLGPGFVGYENEGLQWGSLFWEIDFELEVSRFISVGTGLIQEVEKPFGDGGFTRTQGKIDFAMRF